MTRLSVPDTITDGWLHEQIAVIQVALEQRSNYLDAAVDIDTDDPDVPPLMSAKAHVDDAARLLSSLLHLAGGVTGAVERYLVRLALDRVAFHARQASEALASVSVTMRLALLGAR